MVFLLAALALAGEARAGTPETPAEIAVNPGDPQRWVVRYVNAGGGLIFSEDAGQTWRLLCNRGIDDSINRKTFGFGTTPEGAVFVGAFKGMWRVNPSTCTYDAVPEFEGLFVSDVVNHPSDPQVLFAVTASGGQMNGIWTYDGTLGTWTPAGSRDVVFIKRLRVVRTDAGLRFYQNITDGQTPVMDADGVIVRYRSRHFLRYSDDGGQTWQVARILEDSDAAAVQIEAIDPTDPGRLVFSEVFGRDDSQPDRLWEWGYGRGSDIGRTRLVTELDTYAGAAYGPEGQLWYAGAEGSLWVEPPGSREPEVVVEDLNARCLSYDAHQDLLFACRVSAVFVVGSDGGLTRKLDFRTVDEWLDCGETPSAAARCEPQVSIRYWCGPSHYPDAGVCAAYCYPGREILEGGGGNPALGTAGCDPNTQGTPPYRAPTRDATVGAEPPPGLLDGGTQAADGNFSGGDAGTGVAEARDGGDAREGGDDPRPRIEPGADCSCTVVGARSHTRANVATCCAVVALLAWRARPRRRRRRFRAHQKP